MAKKMPSPFINRLFRNVNLELRGQSGIPRTNATAASTYTQVGQQQPATKMYNKTVQEYNERIQRAREKIKNDEYVTASNLRSMRYVTSEGDKQTKKEMRAAGHKSTDKDVASRELPSTAIAKMRYNPETGSLYITFRSNKSKEYLFPHVGKGVVQNFLTAGSKGRYYWNRIRPYAVSKGEAVALKAERNNK